MEIALVEIRMHHGEGCQGFVKVLFFFLSVFFPAKTQVFLYDFDLSHSTTVVGVSNNPIHHPSIFAGGFPGSKPNCDPPVIVVKGVTTLRLTNPLSIERH